MGLNKIIKIGRVLVLATTVMPPIINGVEKIGTKTIDYVKNNIKKSNKNQEDKDLSNKERDNAVSINYLKLTLITLSIISLLERSLSS